MVIPKNEQMNNRKETEWKCIGKEYVVSNQWLKLRKDKVLLPNGALVDDYYVIEKRDVVLILALTKDNRIVLKEEYRYPINKITLELPGGTMHKGEEAPIEAAKRELLEETGYIGHEWREFGMLFDYPTKDTNRIHLFIAKNIEIMPKRNLDISENIKCHLYSLNEVKELVINGRIDVSGSAAAILKFINSGTHHSKHQ